MLKLNKLSKAEPKLAKQDDHIESPAAAEPVEEKEVKEEVEQLAPPLAVDFEEETPKVETHKLLM